MQAELGLQNFKGQLYQLPHEYSLVYLEIIIFFSTFLGEDYKA